MSQRSTNFSSFCAAVAPAEEPRIVPERADRPAVEPREHCDLRPSVVTPELERRVPVDHQFDQPARVVRLHALAGDQREQLLVAAVRWIVCLDDRRELVDIRGQVGEEAADLRKSVRLVLGLVVDDATAARVDAVAAQLLLVDVEAKRSLHDRRTGGEDLGDVLHHHREVIARHQRGRRPGDRSEPDRDQRELLQHRRDRVPGHVGDVRRAARLGEPDVGTEAVDEAHERQLGLKRHVVRGVVAQVRRTAVAHNPGAAAGRARGVVVGADDDLAAVQLRQPEHTAARHELGEHVAVVRHRALQDVPLAKAPRVDQSVDPLADGELPAVVLIPDALLAAHLVGHVLAAFDFVEFRLPGHYARSRAHHVGSRSLATPPPGAPHGESEQRQAVTANASSVARADSRRRIGTSSTADHAVEQRPHDVDPEPVGRGRGSRSHNNHPVERRTAGRRRARGSTRVGGTPVGLVALPKHRCLMDRLVGTIFEGENLDRVASAGSMERRGVLGCNTVRTRYSAGRLVISR